LTPVAFQVNHLYW